MKKFFVSLSVLFSALLVHAQISDFTYQGRLNDSGGAATGLYDFQFKLYDAGTNGNLFATLTKPAVVVSNGLFITSLHFSTSLFDGRDLWMETRIRTNGTLTYTVLSPLQLISSAPYAIHATRAGTVSAGAITLSSFAPGVFTATNLSGIVPDAQLSTNVPKLINGVLSDTALSTNIARVAQNTWETVVQTNVQALPNHNYCVAIGNKTTIRLPENPAFGDTIRVSSSGGAGGWRIAQTNNQQIMGSSLDLMVWRPRESARPWRQVACSSDGMKVIACATSSPLMISSDGGATWTAAHSNLTWNAVACSSDGSRLFAAVDGGQMYCSTDGGTNWTARDSNRTWVWIACSADGMKVVAAVNGGSVLTSVNGGTNWSSRIFPSSWTSVAISQDGSRMLAAGSGTQIYRSSDYGTNWLGHDSARSWAAISCNADASVAIAAVYNGPIYISADSATSWTPTTAGYRPWGSAGMQMYANFMIAAPTFGTSQLLVSTDTGATWKLRGPNLLWRGVACSTDGSRAYAVANNDYIYVYDTYTAQTTTPGPTGYLSGAAYAAIELQYVGGGVFVPISHEGTITGN